METHRWKVDDEIAGFRILSVEALAEYQGTGYHFKHIETGMEVFQLVNDDRERFFSYLFKTLPNNDCGVAHILEHCVLSGSERYPVRDPFMGLLKGSVNTFMNAMTYPDKTLYPAASPLLKDFDNLFSVYSDAVFSPLLKEETFWREGVRLVCDEAGCHYEGVVFNEMLGDGSNHDSIVGRNAMRALYPDTEYSFNSGGDPKAIVNLDYQQFVSFYNQYYHPSNAKLFLYGDLEVGAKLAYLDEHYLATRGSLNINSSVHPAESWKAQRSVHFSSPTEEEGASANSVVVAWATEPVTDSLAVVTLSSIVDILLGNPAAPLYKAILESGIGEDISPESGMRPEFAQMGMLVGFKGIEASRAEEAEAFLLDTLKKIVEEGIDQALIASSLKRSRFRLLEIPGGMPNGLRVLNRLMRGWVHGVGPTATIGAREPLAALEGAIAKNPRYLEEWIKTNLIENPHRLLVSVTGSETHHDELLEAIAKHADQAAEKLGKKGLKEIVEQNERFDRFESESENEELLATIPRLAVEDLPSEIRDNEHRKMQAGACDLYVRNRFCNGIGYLNVAIDISDLAADEFMLLPFYLRVVQMTGIGERPYTQVATETKDLLGDFGLFLETGTSLEGQVLQTVMCRAKMLNGDAEAALLLIGELLTQTNVTDEKAIAQVLSTLRGEYRDSVTYGAHTFATLAATSRLSAVQYEAEQLAGLSQWLFLESKSKDDVPAIAAVMARLQDKLNDATRLTLHLLCDSEAEATLVPLVTEFASRFTAERMPSGEQRPPVVLPAESSLQIYRLPSSVSYQAYALQAAERGSALQAAQSVLALMMGTNHLWELIRGKGGAYGVGSTVDVMEEFFYFSTYRDPRIVGSFADFKETLARYSAGPIDSKALESALISIIGGDLRPLSPSQESILSFRRLLYRISDAHRARRRAQLLAVDAQAIQAAASALIAKSEAIDSRVIIAGSQLLEKEEKKDAVLGKKAVKLPL